MVLSGEGSEDPSSGDGPSATPTCGVVLALGRPEREVGETGDGGEGYRETGCRESAGLWKVESATAGRLVLAWTSPSPSVSTLISEFGRELYE